MAEANDINYAAHLDHTIEHSYADLGNFLGLAVGIGACIAITVLTGGGAAVMIGTLTGTAGLAGIGGWVGEKLGSLIPPDSDSGRIARGSPDCFYGPEVKRAARMNDRTACESPGMALMETISPFLAPISPLGAIMSIISMARQIDRGITNYSAALAGQEVLESDSDAGAHAGSKIGDGSITVFINYWPAARKGDGVTPCDGKISQGIESIVIGGPQGSLVGTDERSEINRGQKFVQDVVGLIGDPLGSSLAVLSFVSDKLGVTPAKRFFDALSVGASVYGIIKGKASSLDRALSAGSAITGGSNLYGDLTKAPANRYVFDPDTMSPRARP